MKKLISIVIPACNEQDNIIPMVKAILKAVPGIFDTEVILVDDGSRDQTKAKVLSLTKDKRIKGIFLYRNFGHQAALLAGIHSATGEAVITMDADFQHPPEVIPQMLKLWQQGHDLVVAQRNSRDNKGWPRLLQPFRLIGYGLYKLLAGKTLYPGVSDFRLMDKTVAEYLRQCSEYRAILRGLVMLPARQIVFIPYQLGLRRSGKSKYPFVKLLNLFIFSITSFSLAPLRFALYIGALIVISTFCYAIYVVVDKILLHKPIIEGWTSMVVLISILFGMLFFYLGLLGEYIGALFEEVKRRPRYMVESTINLSKHHKSHL